MHKLLALCFISVGLLTSCGSTEPVMNTWIESDVHIKAPASTKQKKVWVGWKGGGTTKSNLAKQLILNSDLWAKGVQVVSNQDDADYALLAEGTVELKRDQYLYNAPTFGQTGISGGTFSGMKTGSMITGNVNLTPTYGVTGSTVQVGNVEYWSVTANAIIIEYETAEIIAKYAGAATIPTSICSRSDWLILELVNHLLVDLPNLKSRNGNYTHQIAAAGNC